MTKSPVYTEQDHDRALERHARFHEDMVAVREHDGADSSQYAYARRLMLDAWRDVRRVCRRPRPTKAAVAPRDSQQTEEA